MFIEPDNRTANPNDPQQIYSRICEILNRGGHPVLLTALTAEDRQIRQLALAEPLDHAALSAAWTGAHAGAHNGAHAGAVDFTPE